MVYRWKDKKIIINTGTISEEKPNWGIIVVLALVVAAFCMIAEECRFGGVHDVWVFGAICFIFMLAIAVIMTINTFLDRRLGG